MRYLFDTNILSELIRQPASDLAERIFLLEREDFGASIIVACELRFGALKKGSKKLTQKVERLLEQIDILPLSGEVSQHYAELRVHLERRGRPIGSNDMLIAAHTRALELTLITANIGEFSRVPDLMVENWL